jgi:hypothetical protein
MITHQNNQSSQKSKTSLQNAPSHWHPPISPLRQRLIRDMELAGLTENTQRAYIYAVVKLQDHYRVRPDKLSENQVQQYIFWLRDDKKVARGTPSRPTGTESSSSITGALASTGHFSHARKFATHAESDCRYLLPGPMGTD